MSAQSRPITELTAIEVREHLLSGREGVPEFCVNLGRFVATADEQVKAFASVAPNLVVVGVPGNHDEAHRPLHTYGDSWAIDAMASLFPGELIVAADVRERRVVTRGWERTLARNPELLGLGIDEDTALVVQGHLGEVVGKGSVTFVDGRGVRFDNADECLDGKPLTLSYLRVGIVGAGYSLNLRERELEVLIQARREEASGTTGLEVLRSEGMEETAGKSSA